MLTTAPHRRRRFTRRAVLAASIAGVCVVLILVLAGGVTGLYDPSPTADSMLALFSKKKTEFTQLANLVQSHCDQVSSLGEDGATEAGQAYRRLVRGIDPAMRLYCFRSARGDFVVRFVLRVQGWLTVGPEATLGIVRFSAHPEAEGAALVSDVSVTRAWPAGEYIQPIEDGWYLFRESFD